MKDDLKINTGRWLPEEQRKFETGIKKFGQNWELIAELVKTRNVTQTRSHAQKYLRSLARKKARLAGV